MDINGLFVSASETIQLGDEEGILLTIFNFPMDFHFCILAHGISVNSWLKIIVNQCYQITNLKVGVLESCSGSKKLVLKTTETSTCKEIESHLVQKFNITYKIKSLTSIPAFRSFSDIDTNCESNLISYQGFVTRIEDVDNGVYELDGKILLYTTFSSISLFSNYLKIGSEIFVSNAHCLKKSKKIILLICGLSSVRNISGNEKQKEVKSDSKGNNFCLTHSLSIYDYLWFERLSFRLKMKFSTLVIEEDISLKRNTELCNNILDLFLLIENEPPTEKKLSLVDEYFSNPHRCIAFTKNRLPVNCDVLYLSDILKRASEHISWINISNNWKISIENQDNMILIGMLSLSSNGHFYISDSTGKLPIVLDQDCSCCSNEHNIIKKFENLEYAAIVAICEYDLISENMFCKSGDWHCLQYIRTSCCHLQHLASFHNFKHQEINNPFLFRRMKNVEEVDEINNIVNDLMHFKFFSSSSQQSHQRFLVLNKIWTVQKNSPVCSRVLVLFIPEKVSLVDDTVLESDCLPEDSLNYYETDDDFEFANLVTNLNHLSIESNPRLGCLCFKNAQHCNFLFPGHIYSANIGSVMKKEKSSFFQSGVEVYQLMASPNLEIVHDPNFLGKDNLDKIESVKYITVKEIILNRKIMPDYIIKGVLLDKFHENNHDRIQTTPLNSTICMKIGDIASNDSIPVYVPYIPESIVGTLPGSLLELYGFFCICSQKGNLYLKASSAFGIEIISNRKSTNSTERNLMNDTAIDLRELPAKKREENVSFLTPFRRMFFLVKIISAEVFSICSDCHKSFKEYCSCPVFSKANIKVSVLIDDGRQVFLAASSGVTAKYLLGLNEEEWKGIASYVEQHNGTLKFSEKMNPAQVNYLPIMNQVFYYYCSSKSTCRQLVLECVYILNTEYLKIDVPSIWCKSVILHQSLVVMSEFYTRLKCINVKE